MYIETFLHSGDDSEGDPPVPIPNTEVKPFNADGTWLDTTRESRKLPVPLNDTYLSVVFLYILTCFFFYACIILCYICLFNLLS